MVSSHEPVTLLRLRYFPIFSSDSFTRWPAPGAAHRGGNWVRPHRCRKAIFDQGHRGRVPGAPATGRGGGREAEGGEEERERGIIAGCIGISKTYEAIDFLVAVDTSFVIRQSLLASIIYAFKREMRIFKGVSHRRTCPLFIDHGCKSLHYTKKALVCFNCALCFIRVISCWLHSWYFFGCISFMSYVRLSEWTRSL